MNSLESVVHIKAILEADSRIKRVDIVEEQTIKIYPEVGEPVIVNLAGWQEVMGMARVVTALEGKI